LWFGASLKFLVPFALLMNLGSRLEWTPVAAIRTETVSHAVVQFTQPFPVASSFAPPTQDTFHWASTVIFSLWACGFAAIFLMRLKVWFRIRAAVRSSAQLEIPAPVQIRSSPGLAEPGVVGFFRPVLLLPAGILKHLTPRQLSAVLAHELCHVRRRDNLFASIHILVEMLFWFHPLVWWIGARLVVEREHACDENVLRLGSEPRVYAEAIVTVCKYCVESPLACVSGITGSDLRDRIAKIMADRIAQKLTLRGKLLLAAAGAAAVVAPIIIGFLIAPRIQAQAPSASAFEVASVKPSMPPTLGGPVLFGMQADPNRFSAHQQTLVDLMTRAYGFDHSRISGGPPWVSSDRFDVIATLPQGTSAHIPSMLQTLLAERFGLVVGRETRMTRIYALVEAKGGLKLKPVDTESPSAGGTPVPVASAPLFLGRNGALGICCGLAKLNRVSMAFFAELLSAQTDRPVQDETGIQGVFNVSLEWTPDDLGTTPEAPSLAGASIYTAVQEQLGLRLEPRTGPLEYLVIEHAEKPTEN
jgi:bla regulator protein BlaR1